MEEEVDVKSGEAKWSDKLKEWVSDNRVIIISASSGLFVGMLIILLILGCARCCRAKK